MEEDDIDVAVAAYRDEDSWRVAELTSAFGTELADVGKALDRFPSDADALALVVVNDDFFVIARPSTRGLRVMLSDVTAVGESLLADDVADLLDLPDPDDDDDPQPGGEMSILADLGGSAADLGELCDDDDASPADVLIDIADRLGFGDELETIIDRAIGD